MSREYQYKTIYPNADPDIVKSEFDQEDAVRLENMCPHCGAIALYAKKTQLGYWIACASVGCDGGFNELLKKAEKQRHAFYRERGVEL